MNIKMKEKIKEYINIQPTESIIEIINGERIQGKYLACADIIVKININIFETGFLNGDICLIRGETIEGKLVVKRLEDGHLGIVKKEQVSLPVWGKYDL